MAGTHLVVGIALDSKSVTNSTLSISQWEYPQSYCIELDRLAAFVHKSQAPQEAHFTMKALILIIDGETQNFDVLEPLLGEQS